MFLTVILILHSFYSLTSSTTRGDEICGQNKLDERFRDFCVNEQCSSHQPRPLYTTDTRFEGVYTFPVKKIQRMDCFDPDAMKLIDNGLPVVLENCSFARPAYKWSLDYLNEHLKDKGHIAYVASQRRFLYFDEESLVGKYKNWTPPHQKRITYFKEFMEMAKTLKQSNNGTRSYFQSPLYIIDGVSSSLEDDINSFDYSWLLDIVNRLGWGEEVINLLLVGMTDVVTPTHYDILENFFVQIAGLKRVILFSPEYFRSLYPYPVGHPHDRQTQVNFDNPDFTRFPKFREIQGLEAIVGPGDVLYIPTYWWHYVESERNNMTVSLSFWFDPMNENTTKSKDSPPLPSAETEKETHQEQEKNTANNERTWELALKREVEAKINEMTGRDHQKVRKILKEILTGRFDFLDAS